MATGTMEAVGAYRGLPIDDPESLQDVVVPTPQLRPRDVLVRVEAVSVNPADVGLRGSMQRSKEPRILGFDAAGVVVATGTEVTTLAVGDDVWCAGDITRAGSNAQFYAVDERIVGHKPASLSHADAAALPLTTITAWESLFDHFQLTAESQGTLLIMGAAGGVGSIMIQLAKELTSLRVLATASRSESAAWVKELGADGVVDHHDLVATTQKQAPGGVDFIFSPHSRGNVHAFATLLRPFGHITAIDDPQRLDLLPLKSKSITWHWELMFTRPMYETADMDTQKRLLETVASLVDEKRLRSTATKVIDDFSATGLREAHSLVESGHAVGKVVVAR
ncbi:zinc-binding alcohol dehydrogenase family protein [Streptomyces sp. NPDC005908]|uniref:zinc-binding alcohol dehydrogenase family protein n=1 Tax=unclassified Streptomyces TaxID=2593676 RepID=UPI0011ABE8A9|nr:zinc-binding alcohol dehydrogenase family protein [Streptomyces sp. T12]TWD29749.1 zinc-binding alcohol dehydrogenase family protein [Streptomyces sp. T12]